MRIHYLQHVTFEGLGCIESWAALHNHTISSTSLYAGDKLPNLSDFDFLIIMGGPMGAYDESVYPWLANEKLFIKSAIGQNKKVLGICLGSQLLAAVMGTKVYAGPRQEIGWFPIQTTEAAEAVRHYQSILKGAPLVFHWHGDTFELPAGAQLLASSEAYNNQWFIINNQLMGIQFHLEVTPQSIASMLDNETGDLQEDTFVQDKSAIIKQDYLCEENNKRMFSILDLFTATQ